MKLQIGAPAELSGRAERELRTYRLLERLNIPFARVDHEPAMTMEACAQIDGILGTSMCKNLFLCNRQKTIFYMLMLPGDKVFKTKELSAQLGVARLSFADESYMLEYLDILPGSVSVLGLMNDSANHVQLLVDRDLMDGKPIGCHPCVNTSSLRIEQDDLWKVFLPAVHHDYRIVDLPGQTEASNG